MLFSPPAATLKGLSPWESEAFFPGQRPGVDFFIGSQEGV